MNKKDLIKSIKIQAEKDRALRKDSRFLDAMGFLVTKGFLQANFNLPRTPNRRLAVDDMVWAGVNVEPRILEVLPAAVLRLEKHFDLDPVRHPELFETVKSLRQHEKDGPAFMGIPFEKFRIWADLPLSDRRIKKLSEKKITKTFRLSPNAIARLRVLARAHHCSETDILERQLLGEPTRLAR